MTIQTAKGHGVPTLHGTHPYLWCLGEDGGAPIPQPKGGHNVHCPRCESWSLLNQSAYGLGALAHLQEGVGYTRSSWALE